MLLDVGLQHCVEMLKLSVSNQSNDVYLSDRGEKQRQLHVYTAGNTRKMRCYVHAYMENHGQVDTRMSTWLQTTACQEISCICWQGTHTHTVTHISFYWVNTCRHSTHSPMHQTQGCRSRLSESVPSWCWTRHPECPAETTHTHIQIQMMERSDETTHTSAHTQMYLHHSPWPPPPHQWFWVSPGFL